MKFMLIAYKPNSDEYCRGCHVGRYDSDIKIAVNITEEELIEEYSNIEVFNRFWIDHQEEKYQILIVNSYNEIVYNNFDDSSKDRDDLELLTPLRYVEEIEEYDNLFEAVEKRTKEKIIEAKESVKLRKQREEEEFKRARHQEKVEQYKKLKEELNM